MREGLPEPLPVLHCVVRGLLRLMVGESEGDTVWLGDTLALRHCEGLAVGEREALGDLELSGALAEGVVVKEAWEGVKLGLVVGTLLGVGSAEAAGVGVPGALLREPEPLAEGQAVTLAQELELPPTKPPATSMPRVDCVGLGRGVSEALDGTEAEGTDGVLCAEEEAPSAGEPVGGTLPESAGEAELAGERLREVESLAVTVGVEVTLGEGEVVREAAEEAVARGVPVALPPVMVGLPLLCGVALTVSETEEKGVAVPEVRLAVGEREAVEQALPLPTALEVGSGEREAEEALLPVEETEGENDRAPDRVSRGAVSEAEVVGLTRGLEVVDGVLAAGGEGERVAPAASEGVMVAQAEELPVAVTQDVAVGLGVKEEETEAVPGRAQPVGLPEGVVEGE